MITTTNRYGLSRVLSLAIVGLVLLGCKPQEPNQPKPTETFVAFPGAEGGGRFATGGHQGTVLHVRTLEDNPKDIEAGTLRYALMQTYARTIVFDVAGEIKLKGELKVKSGNVTIAGQTAPGDGICISGYPFVIQTNNVIVRFVHFRMGDEARIEGDAVSVYNSKNVIIDHCSMSWSTDECVSCYGNENFTLQYCFITESLRNSVHHKEAHGYGGIWGGKNASFHHNLLAHHDSRNPRFDHDYVDATCHGPIDYVNNVVYNWGGNSTYGGESVSEPRLINHRANYYKPGPATNSKAVTRLLDPTTSCSSLKTEKTPALFYLSDNYMFGSPEVTADNWLGSTKNAANLKAETAWTKGLTELPRIETAEDAYRTVLTKAGCSLQRDAIDQRIVEEVEGKKYTYAGSNGSKGGLIDSQTDVGGWPTYEGVKAKDTDGDGIPDAWEEAHGLNINSYKDASECTLSTMYTNLECYLNDIVKHLY